MSKKPWIPPDRQSLRSLMILLNECWSELNERRCAEGKEDLIEAMQVLEIMIDDPVPKYPTIKRRKPNQIINT